jgi:hypothetical protein
MLLHRERENIQSVMKAYRIIELDLIDPLIQSNHLEIAVALLDWLAKNISRELGTNLKGASIEVIKVTYFGSYPTIGVHHFDPAIINEVAPIVEKTGIHILETHLLAEFLRHIETQNWTSVTDNLMHPIE